MRLRLCLSDAASFAALTELYRSQAQMCRQMASVTVNPYKEGWLEFAEEWRKLAEETEAKAELERQHGNSLHGDAADDPKSPAAVPDAKSQSSQMRSPH